MPSSSPLSTTPTYLSAPQHETTSARCIEAPCILRPWVSSELTIFILSTGNGRRELRILKSLGHTLNGNWPFSAIGSLSLGFLITWAPESRCLSIFGRKRYPDFTG
ncbi:hypothetical protein HZ326_3221 [Fusarium oxysporum f. sp. albedinis]|nr:hypothetical protein HZ326_3221 [Fusarium oxysporum f. sp. albedinis]